MKVEAYWVGNGYGSPKLWGFKKEMPAMNPGQSAVKLACRFCAGYALMDYSGRILMAGGAWLPVLDMQLIGHGRVIGPRDLTAADNTPMSEAWRGALSDRIHEEFSAWAGRGQK